MAAFALAGCATAGVLEDDGGFDASDGSAGQKSDASVDSDAGDASAPGDGSRDAGSDASLDAGSDAAADAGQAPDAGADAAIDAGAADAGNPCVPGTYKGSFEGDISLLGVLNLFPITGEIEITVSTDDDSEDVLSIDDGQINGSDQDGNPVTADVSGSMDCVTFELQDGRLTNGVYVREALALTVNFEGTVEADYHPGPVPFVTGTWEVAGGLESGKGSFDAELDDAAP